MKHSKKFFNMIEVVLALGVAAIGLAGIMAVIPVSLKAARSADNENAAADTMNTFFATWDVLLKQADVKDGNKGGWTVAMNGCLPKQKPDGAKINKLKADAPYEKPEGSEDKSYDILSYNGSSFKSLLDGANLSSDGIYRVWIGVPSKDKPYPDFAADLIVWRDAHNIVAWEEKGEGYEPKWKSTGSENDPAIVRVYMEMSWPVTVDYENREKRLFVRDYYNPNYVNRKDEE